MESRAEGTLASAPAEGRDGKRRRSGAGPGGGRRSGPGTGSGRGGRGKRRDVVTYPRGGLDRSSAVRVLVCVDDTDDLTAATSTGYVAELLAQCVCQLGGEVELGITRHQLYLGEGVPYTSHNSSMCFACYLPQEGSVDELRRRAADILAAECAETSDPGLCVWACGQATDPDWAGRLAVFGRAAQQRVCTKDEAYKLAASVPGMTLTEHGGTGDGVIGALAGVGLRLSGDDGRFRGSWNLAHLMGVQGGTLPAETLARRLRDLVAGPVRFVDENKSLLEPDAPVQLDVSAKPVYAAGSITFPCFAVGGAMRPSEKVDLGSIGNGSWETACPNYEPDNDVEEQAVDRKPGCRNCLYRRWTERGFMCVAHKIAGKGRIPARMSRTED